ncbi:MAG: hypothetical protein NZ898_12180 [Myxococcota bacterium]|nr:hypothetical protein [Myxococcota bacterium]MDW8363491.1 hypothetical protein [Myxococcales bacterium]
MHMRSRTFDRAGLMALALVASGLPAARGEASDGPAPTEHFAADPARRVLRLGPMQGDPRGALDPALRAAFIRAVQQSASPSLWAIRAEGPGSWSAAQDGAGVLLDARGVVMVPARDAHERRAPRARLAWVAMGRDGAAVEHVSAVRPEVHGVRAVYERQVGGVRVREQWLHGPLGMEQTFEIARRPAGRGPLWLAVRVQGALRPQLRGGEVLLLDARGRVRGRYGELFVRDARGRRVAARLSVRGREVRIVIDDAQARYPLDVDPVVWVQQARLDPRDGMGVEVFGASVALSSDASRALVGAPGHDVGSNVDQGSAYVFVRRGTTWEQEAWLTAVGGAANDRFGSSVALSADGGRALIGIPLDDAMHMDQGSVLEFVRSDTGWMSGMQFVRADGAAGDEFGSSVALSGDGTRALIGARGDDVAERTDQGSAYAYVASAGSWSQEAQLAPSPAAAGLNFGSSVALDSMGQTAVVGAPNEDVGGRPDQGAAYVFARMGTAWMGPSRLTAMGGEAFDYFGASVAMAGDGTRLIVGAFLADVRPGSNQGAAYVFERGSTSWTQEAQLGATDGEADDWMGWSVAMSSDGRRAVVGAYNADVGRGAGYVFVRSSARSWSQEARLDAEDGADGDRLGSGAAISGEGDVALLGALFGDVGGRTDRGKAYAFVLRLTPGEPCESPDECTSGFCVDGVCCDSACGGGADDCMACATARGGMANGRCTGLTAAAAETRTCRPAAGDCDVPERCVPGDPSCPRDELVPAGTTCRPASCTDGVATSAVQCSGSSADCPEGTGSGCFPYACGMTSCRTACRSAADCAMGATCEGGRCVGTTPSDAGAPRDARTDDSGGALQDSGSIPPSRNKISGCGCRLAGRSSWRSAFVPFALAAVVLGATRCRGSRHTRSKRGPT